MEKYQTLSTCDITSKKINILYPLKSRRNKTKNKKNYLLNLKNINYSSEIDIFNKKNIKHLTIEEYDKIQNDSLNKYKSKGIEDYKEKLKTENIYKANDIKNKNNLANKIMQKNSLQKILNTHKSEKIFIKSQKKNYESPEQSLKIKNSNNNIFNEISKDSLLRQRILFDNSVKNFENYAMRFKTKMPIVKMSTINTKVADFIPMINLVENEKKAENALPPIPSNADLRLFSYFKYPEKNFPEGREQFSVCIKGRHIYLSGGLSTNMKEMNFWSLNIKNIEWKKIPAMNQTNCRFGHTTIYDENKIYIYGGRIKEKNTSILVGLEIYSLKENIFSKPYIQKEPPDRRDHIAIYICNHIF